MPSPQFATGPVVRADRRSLSGPRSDRPFRILGRYLTGNMAIMDRIRSLLGSGERMVPGFEVIPVRATAIGGMAPSGTAVSPGLDITSFTYGRSP